MKLRIILAAQQMPCSPSCASHRASPCDECGRQWIEGKAYAIEEKRPEPEDILALIKYYRDFPEIQQAFTELN